MAKKPWLDFNELRLQLSFKSVLKHFNIHFQKDANNKAEIKANCPFHDDKKHSLSLNKKVKIFYCHSCKKSGGILDFVTLLGGYKPNKKKGIRKGAKLAQAIIAGKNPKEAQKSPSKDSKTKSKVEQRKSQKIASKGKNKPAKALKPPKILDALGNPAPLTFSLKLNHEHQAVQSLGISPEVAESKGIGYCNKGMMKDRVCFPLENNQGELIGYAGMDDLGNFKTPDNLPPEYCLYGEARQGAEKLFLSFRPKTVLTANQKFGSALTLLSDNLSESQAHIIANLKPKQVVLFCTKDDDWEQVIVELVRAGLTVSTCLTASLRFGENSDKNIEREKVH